ncbi:histidinol-phosphatase [uncultured Corynebacterium sp.]|uniref:histidinol-phosphatase n=1 Tax=uncultured Corynebacterium sp. TaxID=159447 RepID=UPI0028D1DC6C|nr:histidinol-phosphatase [uncultured Corynebacterium sp.]
MSYRSDIDFALTLANTADAITVDRFEATDLNVSSKPDMTPVSDADVACEQELRRLITQQYPNDTVVGEEFGGTAEFAGRQWIIDPIDGTKNFVRGVPVWATLIALLVDGIPKVGVISAPALGRRWWAATGHGSFRSVNNVVKEIRVSNVSSLENASISFSSLEGWQQRGIRDRFLQLTDDTWRLRGFGDFFSYCLVAEGAVDIAAEPEVSLWDLAPLAVLVTEAGGRFTSLSGVDGPHGGSAIATNGLLHDQVLRYLGPTE